MQVSVVCPFYNEAEIIEQAIRTMLRRVGTLEGEWELIVVDDGSTDGSGQIARRIAVENERLRVLGYPHNRGRGHALRTGINAARGDIVVTTEIDLSWGEDIVHELVRAMHARPDADIVVASPNLPGGGYRNVPRRRVWLSRLGNRVIRACVSNAVTMNTGMTRAYRREVIQSLPLSENGKEFHLEVILKAGTFGCSIHEIPAVLEWKKYRRGGRAVRRKSSTAIRRVIVSHSLFSVFANPVRYVWAMSAISLALGAGFFGVSVVLYWLRLVSAYTALMSVTLSILGIVLFVLGVAVKQGNMVQRELWMIQRDQLRIQRSLAALTPPPPPMETEGSHDPSPGTYAAPPTG